jgi:dipeptidyl aminopeptidase/acylaminoacyl peptidase
MTTTEFIANTEFNEQFGRTLTAAVKGSADLGEALAVAGRIKPGDLTSWATEWTSKADEVLADADHSLSIDDVVSARRAYLRASEYYRQAFFFARTDLDDPSLHTAYSAHVNAFRAAMPLLPHPTTIVDIEHDGVVIHGYLFRPDDSGAPRPTIIAPAGYDSTAENGYVLNAAAALERNMNCLVIEGPGQGGVLYERKIPLRHDYEAVLTPAVDWLLAQPMRELARFTLVGIADRISCPTLALAGEGDFAGTGQLATFAAALTVPVTTHTFTIAEGAGGHCEGIGQERLEQYAYGWLRSTER